MSDDDTDRWARRMPGVVRMPGGYFFPDEVAAQLYIDIARATGRPISSDPGHALDPPEPPTALELGHR